MRDSGQPEQDRILRSMELHSVEEEVDVTPAIMHKVRQIYQKKQGRNAGNRKKTLIIAMLTAILILSSISVYASQYLIQIKNKEGEVILSTIKPWKYSESEYNTKRIKETEEELSNRLKPGEQAVYYIKDLHMTSLVKEQPLNYFYMLTKHSNYQNSQKKSKRRGLLFFKNLIMYRKGIDLILDRFKLGTRPYGIRRSIKFLWKNSKRRLRSRMKNKDCSIKLFLGPRLPLQEWNIVKAIIGSRL